jgi:Fe2+ transport system protein FeoA
MQFQPVMTLEESPRRVSKLVVSVDDTSEWAPYLRRAGFHEGAEVEILSGRDPVMVRCRNGCVALRRCMLGCVRVCALREAEVRTRRAVRDE